MSGRMKRIMYKTAVLLGNKKGMEMVQVAILVAIAVTIGLIFKTQITEFVNEMNTEYSGICEVTLNAKYTNRGGG